MTLVQLRQSAAFYCEGCPFRCESTPASVLCEHVGDQGGEARRIAFTTGKCPKGDWDHSTPIVPVKTPGAKAAKRAGYLEALPAPVPRENWPEGLAEFEALRMDADKGMGDTLKRLGGTVKKPKDVYALHALIQIAKGAACSTRVNIANALYPY